jgi:hypothetical protein
MGRYNFDAPMLSPVAPSVSEAELANSIRALAMDAVEAAKSGHPGMPMGMAEIAVALWKRHLRHNPANPAWANRDRFVVSNGHGSMLLYSLLHLTGYALPIEELKRFRQLGSRPPATRSTATRPASRPPPDRSARASPTPSAWRSPRSCSPRSSTGRGWISSTITPTCSWATAA